MYDSPLEHCPLCGDWVALDQTLEECARKHACRTDRCALAHLFAPPAPAHTAPPRPANLR